MPKITKEQQTKKNPTKKKQRTKSHIVRNKQRKAGQIPEEVYEAVYKREGGRCALCFRTDIECHHVIPRSRGGRGDDEGNLVMLCKHHHYVKWHGEGDYETYKRVYLYMIKLGYNYGTQLEVLEYKRGVLNK